MRRHTLVALVRDKPDLLTRFVGVCRHHAVNITSLEVVPVPQTGVCELTCVVHAERIDRATRSLSKLVEVIDVREVHDSQADGEP